MRARALAQARELEEDDAEPRLAARARGRLQLDRVARAGQRDERRVHCVVLLRVAPREEGHAVLDELAHVRAEVVEVVHERVVREAVVVRHVAVHRAPRAIPASYAAARALSGYARLHELDLRDAPRERVAVVPRVAALDARVAAARARAVGRAAARVRVVVGNSRHCTSVIGRRVIIGGRAPRGRDADVVRVERHVRRRVRRRVRAAVEARLPRALFQLRLGAIEPTAVSPSSPPWPPRPPRRVVVDERAVAARRLRRGIAVVAGRRAVVVAAPPPDRARRAAAPSSSSRCRSHRPRRRSRRPPRPRRPGRRVALAPAGLSSSGAAAEPRASRARNARRRPTRGVEPCAGVRAHGEQRGRCALRAMRRARVARRRSARLVSSRQRPIPIGCH